jgi:hypothetical protein
VVCFDEDLFGVYDGREGHNKDVLSIIFGSLLEDAHAEK